MAVWGGRAPARTVADLSYRYQTTLAGLAYVELQVLKYVGLTHTHAFGVACQTNRYASIEWGILSLYYQERDQFFSQWELGAVAVALIPDNVSLPDMAEGGDGEYVSDASPPAYLDPSDRG